MKASSEYVEFVHFAAHFYHIKKSDSYDARKVFKIDKKIVNQFLAQVQKEGNALPLKVSSLIKFAKQLEKGVTAEEQNSDESEKKESKSEAKKAKVVIRNSVLKCQYTEGADGKLNIQGSYEDNLKTLKDAMTKLNAYQASILKKIPKINAEQQAKADMEMA